VQNRYLWERFQHEKNLMQARRRKSGVNEQWLWHGTSCTDPIVICGGLDNIDFRMVRGKCVGYVELAPSHIKAAVSGKWWVLWEGVILRGACRVLSRQLCAQA